MSEVVKSTGRDIVADSQSGESKLAQKARQRLEGITLIALERAGLCNIDTGFIKSSTPATASELMAGSFSDSPVFRDYFGAIAAELENLKRFLAEPYYELDTPEKRDAAAKEVFKAAVSDAIVHLTDPKDRLNSIRISEALNEAAFVGVRRVGEGGGYGGSGQISR